MVQVALGISGDWASSGCSGDGDGVGWEKAVAEVRHGPRSPREVGFLWLLSTIIGQEMP